MLALFLPSIKIQIFIYFSGYIDEMVVVSAIGFKKDSFTIIIPPPAIIGNGLHRIPHA